jgi:hypothetical protein
MQVIKAIHASRFIAGMCMMLCLFLAASYGVSHAANKIPIALEIDAVGTGAEDFGHELEKYFRTSEFYVLDKKKTPRIGVSVNASSKKDNPVIAYALVLTVTNAKCPQVFVGTIFGDTSDEDQKSLQNKIEKAIMSIAKEFNL